MSEVRLTITNKLMKTVDELRDELGFGTSTELVRQAVREFIWKYKDFLKKEV